MMRPATPPILTHIVLVGAGHAHVEVLRRFRLRPRPWLRVTLVTPHAGTSYSGMLPGYIAGHYANADMRIDVARLADFSGCTTILARASGLDPHSGRVLLEDGRSVSGDLISLDIGAATQLPESVPGTKALAVKPTDEFERAWPSIEQRFADETDCSVGVVGAGPAGVELALAIRYRLTRRHAGATGRSRIVLLEKSDQILPGFLDHVRKRLLNILAARQVEVRLNSKEPEFSGEFGLVIWSAGVRPMDWLARSGLATDRTGFVTVNRNLQSTSHRHSSPSATRPA